MSRIGKKFITIPSQVNVELDGQKISVKGPKGSLSRILPSLVCCSIDEKEKKVFVDKAQESKLSRSLHGLSRTLVANMVTGVSVGSKKLQVQGSDIVHKCLART